MTFQRLLSTTSARLLLWGKRAVAVLAIALLPGFASAITPVSVPVNPGDEKAAKATAHLVKSVLEYTRWPIGSTDPIHLCVIGQARFGTAFPHPSLSNGRSVIQRNLAQIDTDTTTACDALYIGNTAPERIRASIAKVRGAPVVTIAEQDPQCTSEAMICLVYGVREISFQLNMDAVARSKVRIDPRLFRMSKGGNT